jgi:hypothetical protein
MHAGSPPGLGGVPGVEGFGHVVEAGACYRAMARVLLRAGELTDHVETDSINVKQYVKEIAALVADLAKATGRMFEQEPMRMIIMVTSIHLGGVGGGSRFTTGLMEHRVIQNLRAVS